MRGARESDALLYITDLSGESEVSNFDDLIFKQNVGWLDVPVEEAFFSVVGTSRNDLRGEGENI